MVPLAEGHLAVCDFFGKCVGPHEHRRRHSPWWGKLCGVILVTTLDEHSTLWAGGLQGGGCEVRRIVWMTSPSGGFDLVVVVCFVSWFLVSVVYLHVLSLCWSFLLVEAVSAECLCLPM
jgi:hypothetical protein